MTQKTWKIFFLIAIVMIAFGRTGQAKSIKFKIAALPPESTMLVKKMIEGADQIAKETNSRVTFKFYAGGRMGKDKAVLQKIRRGQLHGGALITGSLSDYFPANQLYAQPMKFKTLDEIDYIRKHMDDFIVTGLEENGFVTFGLIGGGFSYIMSKYPIQTVQDLRKHKVWIPPNETIPQASIKAFGFNPIPLPIQDVLIGLESGMIDTVANSPYGAIVLQWHTHIKYVTRIPLIYVHGVLAIDRKKFMEVAAPDRKIIRQIMGRVSKEIQSQNRINFENDMNVLAQEGITFITPSSEAMLEWEATGEKASRKMIETGILPQKIADELDMHLKHFHESGRAANAD